MTTEADAANKFREAPEYKFVSGLVESWYQNFAHFSPTNQYSFQDQVAFLGVYMRLFEDQQISKGKMAVLGENTVLNALALYVEGDNEIFKLRLVKDFLPPYFGTQGLGEKAAREKARLKVEVIEEWLGTPLELTKDEGRGLVGELFSTMIKKHVNYFRSRFPKNTKLNKMDSRDGELLMLRFKLPLNEYRDILSELQVGHRDSKRINWEHLVDFFAELKGKDAKMFRLILGDDSDKSGNIIIPPHPILKLMLTLTGNVGDPNDPRMKAQISRLKTDANIEYEFNKRNTKVLDEEERTKKKALVERIIKKVFNLS